MLFQDLGARKVVADFSGGHLSSDGGALLLRQVDAGLGVSRALARCFADRRRQDLIEHRVPELIAQRLYALALGYEDLNDHTQLRRDPLWRQPRARAMFSARNAAARSIEAMHWPARRRLTGSSLVRSFPTTIAKCIPMRRRWDLRFWKWGCAACPRTRKC